MWYGEVCALFAEAKFFRWLTNIPIRSLIIQIKLTISYGNSAPENGFSINKAMLDINGYSLDESTIKALWFAKDAILKHSSILDIPIARSLLVNVKGYT